MHVVILTQSFLSISYSSSLIANDWKTSFNQLRGPDSFAKQATLCYENESSLRKNELVIYFIQSFVFILACFVLPSNQLILLKCTTFSCEGKLLILPNCQNNTALSLFMTSNNQNFLSSCMRTIYNADKSYIRKNHKRIIESVIKLTSFKAQWQMSMVRTESCGKLGNIIVFYLLQGA